jgi:hypothetical protein
VRSTAGKQQQQSQPEPVLTPGGPSAPVPASSAPGTGGTQAGGEEEDPMKALDLDSLVDNGSIFEIFDDM